MTSENTRELPDTVENAAATPDQDMPWKELGLKEDEYQRICDILGRRPTNAELAMYSVMWSEHCSYKSSKKHLAEQFGARTTDAMRKNLLVGMGQNAGVVDIGGGWAVTFKVESHNHPSFVEPYQGAATGVGGIVRDIISMGARPIAVMDQLRFGAVGYVIRRAVDESPVFEDLRRRRQEASAPLGRLFRKNTKQVVLTALIFIGNNAAGYLLIAFFATYAVTALGMERPPVLLATTLASFGWLIFTLWGGHLSDRLGRVRTFQIGYIALALWAVPMWFLIDTANIFWYFVALFVMTFALGLSYGPQAALYAEMFPANVRYSGVSIGYALGAILGGAFAPMIAETLLNQFQAAWTIGVYIAVAAVISLIGVSMVKETKGIDLHA